MLAPAADNFIENRGSLNKKFHNHSFPVIFLSECLKKNSRLSLVRYILSEKAFSLTDVECLQHVDALMTQLNVFATGCSGWVVATLTRLEIKTVSSSKVTGGSYIETPPILKPLNRSILNVVNKCDNFCFLYCVAAALFSFIGRVNSPKTHKRNIERLSFNS